MTIAQLVGNVTSSPPILRSEPLAGPTADLDVDLYAAAGREDGTVCFAVQGGPPGSSRTHDLGGGSVGIATVLRGRILSVGSDLIEMDAGGFPVRIRYLIPGGVSLEPLAGHVVELQVGLLLHRDRGPTVDAVIRDTDGLLLLWARDGSLPSDRESQGVVVRVAQAPGGPPRLVFATPGSLSSVTAGGSARVDLDGGLMGLALRVAADDAAFCLVRA